MSASQQQQQSWLLVNAVVWFSMNLLALAIASSPPSAMLQRRQVSKAALWSFRETIQAQNEHGVLTGRILDTSSIGGKLPLVVFLHGAGERGNDNLRQLWLLPQLMASPCYSEKYPCIVLAPQCPYGSDWSRHSELLMSLIEQIADQCAVDRDRIYLTGLSMGGFGAWNLAARYPDTFAAVVPVCGGGKLSDATNLSGLPIWAVHGDADQTVSVRNTREIIDAMRQLGATPRYSELPGVGHNSYIYAYDHRNGILDWMFQQRRKRPAQY